MKLRPTSLIEIFALHRVAANLLMLIMIVSGLWALTQLNTQFLPTFHVQIITVSVDWPGASAEDVERSVVEPIEVELRNIDYLKKMTSSSRIGHGVITLEFEQQADMGNALEEVKERVGQVRNLPQDSEEPIIVKKENFEEIARIVFTGVQDIQELRPLIRKIERDLLDNGIAKVAINGLAEQEMAIEVPTANLVKLNMSLNQIAQKVGYESRDIPSGAVGRASVSKQLRGIQQRRSVMGFESIPLKTDSQGQLLLLGDIATIKKRPRDYEVQVTHLEKPAVELTLYRTENSDTFAAVDILQDWYKSVKNRLPQGLHVTVYYQTWQLIVDRINLLLKNGGSGLILILLLLFIFLNWRIAFWVGMGIPTSFAAGIFIMYVLGNSINMVTLFAMIMTLGIIVDDTIVVGEEALTLVQKGHAIRESVILGAKRMFVPVMCSSLTTICAFLPLLLVGDVIGKILKAIPIVVISIIAASVLECFLVLPGHLQQSFRHLRSDHQLAEPRSFDLVFEKFRNVFFRRFVGYAIHHRLVTLAVTLGFLLLGIGLIVGGRVNFNFFPSPDGTLVFADVQFHAGTPEKQMKAYLEVLSKSLQKTDNELRRNGTLVKTEVSYLYKGSLEKGESPDYASITVELTGPDKRQITNQKFVDTWRENTPKSQWVNNLMIAAPKAGPPGEDINIQLSGLTIESLKQAAEQLKIKLAKYRGVSNVTDDLPYGQEQLVFDLKPQGEALGLTVSNIGQQLSGAFIGALAQVYHEPNEEIEVRVMLPKAEKDNLNVLSAFPIITPQGTVVPLYSVADFKFKRGFDIINHTNTKLTVNVTAEVNSSVANSNNILANINKKYLPQLAKQYGVKYSFEGKAEEQRETLRDMKYGMMLALVMIYIILAWVFASYGWPIVVMIAIPLGLIGAIIGHWVMGMDLTILSLFGFFGLAGIVINDSIILIVRYKELRGQMDHHHNAVIEASCQRLRAVLLTSLTTIAGLTPLLFERSLQAQFLIPMAISITFGLAFATLLILVVVPTLLSLYEDGMIWWQARSGKTS